MRPLCFVLILAERLTERGLAALELGGIEPKTGAEARLHRRDGRPAASRPGRRDERRPRALRGLPGGDRAVKPIYYMVMPFRREPVMDAKDCPRKVPMS